MAEGPFLWLTTEGFAGMADALSLLLNEAMRLERQNYLQAAPAHRRTPQLRPWVQTQETEQPGDQKP